MRLSIAKLTSLKSIRNIPTDAWVAWQHHTAAQTEITHVKISTLPKAGGIEHAGSVAVKLNSLKSTRHIPTDAWVAWQHHTAAQTGSPDGCSTSYGSVKSYSITFEGI